ncbi:MAG: ATP-dependent sacrificial sulfur transferase LarE [Candidatus Altiarchaeota archaeon]
MSSDRLRGFFKGRRSVLVAYSGGVDSSVVAKAAYDALGRNALAVTFDTPTIPRRELKEAKETTQRMGIKHIIVRYNELDDEDFRRNPPDRCYYCKRSMSAKLKEIAKEHGIDLIVDGTNVEDLKGHRPGYRALTEARISSPLAELGFTKKMVRTLARRYGLDYEKPSAACLSSRIPRGERITRSRLMRVEAAEDYLKSLGLSQVRVRLEGPRCENARIEVFRREFPTVLKNAERIVKRLKFSRVTLDLSGYS